MFEKAKYSDATYVLMYATVKNLRTIAEADSKRFSIPLIKINGIMNRIEIKSDTLSKEKQEKEENDLRKKYNNAMQQKANAKTEKDFLDAQAAFDSLGNYSDSKAMAKKCLVLSYDAKKNEIYNDANERLKYKDVKEINKAIELLDTISGWKDADEKKKEAVEKLELLKQIKKKKTKKTVIAIAIAVFLLVFVVGPLTIALTPNPIKPKIQTEVSYRKAVKLLKEKQYDEAKETFGSIIGYKDSQTMIFETDYQKAVEALESVSSDADYDKAEEMFISLENYKDSADLCKETKYRKANFYYEQNQYEEAIEIWETIEDYKDSADLYKEAKYREADSYYEQNQYEDAIKIWYSIADYKDSRDRVQKAKEDMKEYNYQLGLKLMETGEYEEASKLFKDLKDYKDSSEKATESLYNSAKSDIENEKYGEGINKLETILYYKDANDIYLETSYNFGLKLLEEKNYPVAISFLEKASGYKDSNSLKDKTAYNYACKLMDEKNYNLAVSQFSNCLNYKDSKKKLNEAEYAYVKSHMNRYDNYTYEYLKDLMSKNYSGAKGLYSELF